MSPQNRVVGRVVSEAGAKPKLRQKPLFEDAASSLVVSRVQSDPYKCIMTSLMVGKGISRNLSEEDVFNAATSCSAHPTSFKSSLLRRVATLQVGGKWDSQKSSKLRMSFRDRIPSYIDDLTKIVPLPIQDHRIYGSSVVNSVEQKSDSFAGFWACAIKKARTKKRGAPVAALVREFRKDGSVMYVLAKYHGKEPRVADDIIDMVSESIKSPEDFKSVDELFDTISDVLAPEKATLFLALRNNGFFSFWAAGKVFVFTADGELIHHGTEENLIGSNYQNLVRKRVRRRIKVSPLRPVSRVVDSPILATTVPVDSVKFPLSKKAAKELAKDHHCLLATFA